MTKTQRSGAGSVLLIAIAFALTGCGSSAKVGDVIPPVTMNASELQGADVSLAPGQVLNINTGDLAVDSYSGEVADPKVAEFVQGRNDGSAEFNPGILALSAGSAEVTMTNAQGGIQALKFTVTVTK